jgi:excinuclease ABC subunit A
VDLGPDGGDRGGRVVAAGTPEDVARTTTHTGRYLRRVLVREPDGGARGADEEATVQASAQG